MKVFGLGGREQGGLRRAALAVCLSVFLAVVPHAARAQYFGQNQIQYKPFDFKVISSPNFDVYFDAGSDSLALRVLDLAEKANRKLSADLGHTLERKIPLIVYASYGDFEQTNVLLDDGGSSAGGFSEVLRNRVVIPFPGSYGELEHEVVHELTHAYLFDMLYGGGIVNAISHRGYFAIPPWFAEGLAEYESLGWNAEAEMVLRDATISGHLPPLAYSGGYLMYKQGQAAIRYLVQAEGPDKLRDLLQKMKFHRSFDRAFEASLGTGTLHFNQGLNAWLRRMYWPQVRDHATPETFAHFIGSHRRDRSSMHLGVQVAPAGDHVAYLIDHDRSTDLFVMAGDGKGPKRIWRGERKVSFEAMPSFRTGLSWSSDGRHLAVVEKSRTKDVLCVIDADDGSIVRKVPLDLDGVSMPAWNPKSDDIALVGMKDGRSDLYLLSTDGKLRRLTDDAWDERQPAWSPDGKRIVFSSDRVRPIALEADRRPQGFGDYGLFEVDVASGAVRQVLHTSGNDSDPTWSPDGRRLAFVSDRGGARNLYLYDPADSSFLELTDLVGGVYSLSWARQTGRLVFSALNEGGWELYESKESLGPDSVVTRLKREKRDSLRDATAMAAIVPLAAMPPRPGGLGALAPGSKPASKPPAPDSAQAAHPVQLPADSLVAKLDSMRVAKVDSMQAGQPFALPESLLAQKPARYRPALSSDFAGGGFQYNSGFGFAGSTNLSISDFLGDRRLQIGADIFSSSLREMNVLAMYTYLPKRVDYGFGVYHFNNYLFSTVTALGERFSQPRYFHDETFGGVGTASYPFDRTHRLDLALTQMMVNRTFIEDEDLTAPVTKTEWRLVTAPSATLVYDNTIAGSAGPLSGTRSFVNFSPALPVFHNSMQYETAILDYRRYFNMGAGYQFAVRGMSAASFGPDQQAFQFGGASTVRGYDDFALTGTRIAFTNFELRFPFVDALGALGPVPLNFLNLRGVAFADNAVALSEFRDFHWTFEGPDGKRRLQDLKFSFGGGLRSAIAFLVVKVDVAWHTNFHETSQPIYHFSLGPEF